MIVSNKWLWLILIVGSCTIATESARLDSAAEDVMATRIHDYMDENVNPCDNFYKYVCGNFLRTANVPNQRKTLSSEDAVMAKAKAQLTEMLKEPSQPNELRVFKFMKQFYNRCLDQGRIDQEGFEPVFNLINRLGGWPILDGDHWNDETWSWDKFTQKCRENGLSESYFLDLSMTSNPTDSSKSILRIQSPHAESIGYDYDHTDDAKYHVINRKYIVYIARMIAGNGNEDFDVAKVEAAMAEVLQFTNELMKISEPIRANEPPYKPMTLKEMTIRWPSISWLDYIVKLLPQNVKINEDEVINVVHPNYLTSFEELIRNTPKKVQANFGIWQILLDLIGFLPSDVQRNRVMDLESLGLPSSFLPRNEYCFAVTNAFFSVGMNALYIRRNFVEHDKQTVAMLATGIKNQLLETLYKIKWMDSDSKELSLEKVVSITNFIAYHDKIMDDETLENSYNSFELNCNSFLQCYLDIYHHTVDKTFSELKKPVNDNLWAEKMLKFGVKIFYSPNKNSITLPAEILQDIIFERSRPNYVNYGVLGSIIGEKMLNSFDNIGRIYNKNGNLNNIWTNYTKERFNQKAACFINQYNNYIIEEVEMKLDGAYNVESNIVRQGGIKLAYQAYINWVVNNGAENLLPQFTSTYTPEKLFWISFANANCIRMHPNYLKRYIKYGHLIPPENQVNGALSNIPEFSTDFNCPEQSKMRRTDTCSVW